MSDWEWELTDTSRRDFDGLDDHARDRIASKLDEIVTDDWRAPPDHLEPLHGAPHQKLRIGPSGSAVVSTTPTTSSTSCESGNTAAMHTAATTTEDRTASLADCLNP